MPPRRLLLGVLVTVIWGFNFSLIKIAEDVFHPFLLSTLRFVLCVFPAVFFFPRPKVPFRYILLYGLVFGVLNFGLLFAGISAGLAPGLASVVLQLQVFFTIIFGILLVHDPIRPHHVAGILLGFTGIGVTFAITDGSMTVFGLLLVAGAGLAWGLANALARMARPQDAVGFMVWTSVVPILPLAALTVLFEGLDSIQESFANLTWGAAGSVLYLVYPTTLFGYAVWNNLLRQHPTAVVAPLSLLVPFFGLAGSMLIFGERITLVKGIAVALMIFGLAVNQFWPRLVRRPEPPAPSAEPVPSIAP
jgi:O-acetylserine/cysteine efflux transporter